VVGAEVDVRCASDDATRLRATYFERLLRADLSGQLSAAVRRGDSDLPAMFGALADLVAAASPEVVAGSSAVARAILEPPLRRWYRVPRAARASYWRLLDAALVADPDVVARASDPLARASLAIAVRSRGTPGQL